LIHLRTDYEALQPGEGVSAQHLCQSIAVMTGYKIWPHPLIVIYNKLIIKVTSLVHNIKMSSKWQT